MAETGTKADSLRKGWGQPHDTTNRDIAVDKLWWVAFTAGSLLIVGAGWVPVPYFYAFGLVLPLIVLLGYAYVGLTHTSNTDSHSQFADSIYYLGFIFTLVTLAVALVYLATQDDWDTVPLDELIGRFGLALSTTILGLAIRVATVNLSPSEVGLREDADQSLIRSVDNFRNHLESSSDAFKSVTDTYLNEMEKATQLSSTLMQDNAKTTSVALTEAVGKVTIAVENSAVAYDKKFRTKMEEMKFPDEIIADSLSSSIEKITAGIDAMPAVIAKSLTSQRKIAEQSEKVAERYSGLDSALEPLSKFVESLGSVGAQLQGITGNLRTAVQTIESRFGNAANRFENLSRAIEQIVTGVATLEQRLKQLDDLAGTMEQNIAIAKTHRQELELTLTASRNAVEKLHDELVVAATIVTDKLGR